MVAPDLRGFGESSRPREEDAYMLRNVQADVVALLDALGVRECAPRLCRPSPCAAAQQSVRVKVVRSKRGRTRASVTCRCNSTAVRCGSLQHLSHSN